MVLAIVATVLLQEQVSLRPGLVITKSATVRKQEYIFPNDDETSTNGAIIIKGDDITVDFNGATLRGTDEETEPDKRKGTGLTILGNNVIVRNLNVHGYKVAISARYCKNLKIVGCDLSYNWKQHLGSTLEREDTADWMSYHQNEKDEWLRYGAAIYLRDCNDFEVKGCTAHGGQCGLMMTECNGGLAWNNDFSFLSGIGVGLYHSSNNRVLYNKIDWCVRGYSHGVYNRGQDSAGILIYEQSNDNVFAYNSV
ncbi:MAG TPA: right-handed parallel beta-helix repeat-containing protein, partial [Fimbriimonadaceae bacterium]|nr:right-handed parallel beta-helix repeat-containing protein [Fimbriimonadaceae bacterium]